MNFDFQAIMLIALVFTGAIWILDKYLWAPNRLKIVNKEKDKARAKQQIKEPLIVEYSKSFFPIILVVFVLRSFIVEPFRIPSASMMPTLQAGDFILVNKYTYGVKFPLIGTEIIEVDQPARGDVIVFRYPEDPSIDYIKRVIGLPGDRITYIRKNVYINGELMTQESLGTYIGEGVGKPMSGASLRIEHLGDVEHKILVRTGQRSIDAEYVVPEGHYFVMGDNRDNSNDSRFWGTVPKENLVGKAFMIWMNWDSEDNAITWQRIGASIR